MKKLTDKVTFKSKKSTSKASKKKFDNSGRPRLLKIFTMSDMKYRINKIPPHPLHMGNLCNCAFGEEIKEYFGENVLEVFRNIIFGIFLDLPWCNWIGQISKCLLMLEIQQDNKDELHVWVQGEILKFTMLEFAIISDLKCTGNIDDYMYTSSSKSALMSRYFFNNIGAITHSKLITRVQNGNFDNAEDALNLTILFFVHTFMFSQHKEAPISVAHFQIVEDGRYIHFPWGKHSYKNIQPTTDEVSRLNLSFSKDFEICDPTTYASTSDSEKLKRIAVVLQQRVGTIVEEFGDFSTIPPWEIPIKAGFESTDQPLKKRKTVMFDQEKQAVMDGDTSECGHTSHQHKSVPSSSTQPEGTSKSSLDGDEINNYINKCFAEKMAELVTLISKIHVEVVKALKNEQNKQSQDELMAYEEEYSDEDLGKKNISDVEDLPDVNLTSKEDVTKVNLKNQESTDVTDVQVQELQASKSKAPGKQERKKSRVLRSPYILKHDSGSKDAVDIDKEENLKYAFDGYNINQDFPNKLMIDYSQWIAIGLLKTHSAKDCDVFVCAYAEILSEELQVHSCGFDSACQCECYASLLWHYRVKKANEGYTSDNGDPSLPRKSVIEEIEANATVTLE
ncbi:hypothetical protein FXO38_00927 [Capsicum annuum]|nr:hypothetical protein FXO38_00927 [Capsicum annuum]